MLRPSLPLAALLMLGCPNDPQEHNEGEVITAVVLTFEPQTGGGALEFRWSDPQAAGSPTVDAISLPNGAAYDLSVAFWNDLADPPEDLTAEIAAEAEEHQVFFTGTAIEGPANPDNAEAVLTQAYADEDANGLPVGLRSTIAVDAAGGGTFEVTLRHLPPEDGVPTKAAELAAAVAAGGFGAIPGESDASVSFGLTVL